MDVLSLLSHPLWFLCSLVLAVVLRMQKKGRWHSKKCRVDLTGKTAIVTGANTGIGKFVALDFARRNGRVILACRSRERGQKALEEIQRVTGNRNVVLEILDTSSMSSVRAFADRILRNEKRLDILVNNAGVSDLMKRSAPSRIVFLASFVHYQGYIDTSNLYGKNMEKQKVYETYYCTKLMNVSCAREFADRLKTTGVTVTSVSPGIAMTEAMRHNNLLLRVIFKVIGFFFFKSAEEGAASTIFCAVSEEAEGLNGQYVDSDCVIELPSKKARDPAVNKKLWEASEAATNRIGGPAQ
ncbi:retinol dehydrogenase 11-like isoform X7 [Lithobates pipiens]